MNKILGCGNTAMKLGTGGEKGLLSTGKKTRFQPNHHILAEDDIPLALQPYNRHLRPMNTFFHILADFHFCHQGGAGKFLCFFTPQYVPILKRKLQFHRSNIFYFINFQVYIAKAQLPDKQRRPNLAGRFLDNLAINPSHLSSIKPSVPLLQTGETYILSTRLKKKKYFDILGIFSRRRSHIESDRE